MTTLIRALRALEAHWIGDLIGAVCLFALLFGFLTLGWVLA